MLLALTTGHEIGLALSAAVFIAFSLVCAMVIPRDRPDFPGRALPAFVVAVAALFVGMLGAVEVFGAETKKGEETTAPTRGPSPELVAAGKKLYVSRSCNSCHTVDGSAGVGPTWTGLAGSNVKLADGTTLVADDAYLTTSILDPDKEIVQGFGKGVMSAAVPAGSVSEADSTALVAYIDSLK